MRRTHGLDREGHLPHRYASLLRWVRRLLVLAMGVTIVLFLRRYEITRLDDALHEALEGRVRPGAILFIARPNAEAALGAGSIVQAHVDVPPAHRERIGRAEGLILSEILGVPGMTLALEDRGDGVEILLDGRPLGARVTRELIESVDGPLRLRQGPIPEGLYLLVNPNREVLSDSRTYGLVPRERLRKVGHL